MCRLLDVGRMCRTLAARALDFSRIASHLPLRPVYLRTHVSFARSLSRVDGYVGCRLSCGRSTSARQSSACRTEMRRVHPQGSDVTPNTVTR